MTEFDDFNAFKGQMAVIHNSVILRQFDYEMRLKILNLCYYDITIYQLFLIYSFEE